MLYGINVTPQAIENLAEWVGTDSELRCKSFIQECG
jgi:hypothetical protein